jgi:hypothetical protein
MAGPDLGLGMPRYKKSPLKGGDFVSSPGSRATPFLSCRFFIQSQCQDADSSIFSPAFLISLPIPSTVLQPEREKAQTTIAITKDSLFMFQVSSVK